MDLADRRTTAGLKSARLHGLEFPVLIPRPQASQPRDLSWSSAHWTGPRAETTSNERKRRVRSDIGDHSPASEATRHRPGPVSVRLRHRSAAYPAHGDRGAGTGRWDALRVVHGAALARRPRMRLTAYRNSSLAMRGGIAHMRTLCAERSGPGVLATSMARWPAGARSRRSPPTAPWSTPGDPAVQDEGAWSVVCFVVRPGSGAADSCTSCWMARSGSARDGRDALEGYGRPWQRARRPDQRLRGHRPALRGVRIQARPPDRRPARRQAPLARPPRASLTSPAACSPASPRCSRLARCPRAGGLPGRTPAARRSSLRHPLRTDRS